LPLPRACHSSPSPLPRPDGQKRLHVESSYRNPPDWGDTTPSEASPEVGNLLGVEIACRLPSPIERKPMAVPLVPRPPLAAGKQLRRDMESRARRTLHGLLAYAALSVGLALLGPAATAGCLYLNASGSWTIRQSNGPIVQLELQQDGSGLRGSGFYGVENNGLVRGSVEGSVAADSIRLTAHWENGTIGEYSGKMDYHDDPGLGRQVMRGETFDQAHPDAKASWYDVRRFGCAADDGVQPDYSWHLPPPPTPPIALGRTKAPAPQPGTVNRPVGAIAAVPYSAPTSPKTTACALAASARGRHAADAASLEAKCRALGGP
jgi:hypothetical protein